MRTSSGALQEQVVDVPVPHFVKELVEFIWAVPQERIHQRTLEQTVEGLDLLRTTRSQPHTTTTAVFFPKQTTCSSVETGKRARHVV